MSSRSSGENEIAAAIWGRDRSNWGGGVVLRHVLFGGYFLRYELFSIGGVHPDRTNRGGMSNTGSTLLPRLTLAFNVLHLAVPNLN